MGDGETKEDGKKYDYFISLLSKYANITDKAP